MKKLIIVGAALIAAPVAAQTSPPAANQDDPSQMICRMITETGSRLNRTRVCMTRAQWAQQRREMRDNVERAQTIPGERPSG